MFTKKLKQLLIHTLPLIFGIACSYFFWKQKMLLLAIYVLVVLVLILTGKDKRTEFLIFIYGAVIGFFIETIGTQASGYESFTTHDILGIPYWLLVAWGYGFILMKRIGLIIGKGSPWLHRKQKILKINDLKIYK